MQIDLGKPQPKQVEFLKAKERYIAYGGARGGGKSWSLRCKLKILCFAHPGIKVLLIRRTYAELVNNHIDILRQELPPEVAKYNDKDKKFVFANGSILKLGYLDNESDVLQYQGQEYDVIALDEATQLSENQYIHIKACLRGANDFPKHMYFTCNPGGIGHAWVKRLFIDREYKNGENPDDYRFISAKVYDNKILLDKDPDYISTLESLPDDIRAAWLDGRWDVYDGQYFGEFDRNIHVCEPFVIPDDWYRYRAFDYGLDMLACVWVAVDREGYSYVYRELNQSDLIVSDAARAVLDATPENEIIRDTYAPPDLWSRQRETGKSSAEIFGENGLDIIKASNDRVSGWMCVKEGLKPIERRNEQTGESKTASRLQIFSTCRDLIRNIPLLQHDAKNVNDCATEPHDITHNTDALRYYCVSYFSQTPELAKPEESKLERYKNKILGQPQRRGAYRW